MLTKGYKYEIDYTSTSLFVGCWEFSKKDLEKISEAFDRATKEKPITIRTGKKCSCGNRYCGSHKVSVSPTKVVSAELGLMAYVTKGMFNKIHKRFLRGIKK